MLKQLKNVGKSGKKVGKSGKKLKKWKMTSKMEDDLENGR